MLNRIQSPFPILTTDRLTLRRLSINDDKEIFTLRSDSEINKYLGRQISNSIDDARGFIHKVNENIDNHNSLYWAITLHDTDNLVGTICLFGFSDENDNCEIGYELLTNFQGQGLMQEAAQKVIDYAFSTLEVKRIDAFFHVDNQRSVKLLKKFSFVDSHDPDKADPDLVYWHLEK